MTSLADEVGSEAPESGPSNYVGLVIDDRYQVLRPLGSGGMGQIVLARHRGLKRLVAIKFLERVQVADSGATQRLFREAQAAAAIGHPNIVDVLDVGIAPWGDPYLVMEYLEGEDLSTFTDREGALTVPEALFVIDGVLQGLAAAHELGIVHRDLKPQNIVLSRRRSELTVKIIDFGVAKVSAPGITPLTKSGELVGTPSFMSPEQAKGEDVDARSDLFCVGVLLHRLLAGKNPFSASNYHSLLHLIATGEPELARDALPEDLASFIECCLHKDPRARFQSAERALEALRGVAGWSDREHARRTLAARIRSVECDPDTVVDKAWTPSGERAPSPRSHTAVTPLSASAVYLEPTLAAAPPSSSAVEAPARKSWRPWAAWVVLTVLAFGGGWWAARPSGNAVQPASLEEGTKPEPKNELQIGRNATVKLYPASPTPSGSDEAPSGASPSATSSGARPSVPSRGSGGPPVTATALAEASGPPAAEQPPVVVPTTSPSAALGRAGKNSFFSEVFE